MIQMTIGEKIAYARKKRGFSQGKLAELLNVSRAQLYQWEKGIRHPKANTLEMICTILMLDNKYFDSSVNEEELDDHFKWVPTTKSEVNDLVFLYSDEEDAGDPSAVKDEYIRSIRKYINHMTLEELRLVSRTCLKVFYSRAVDDVPKEN